MVTRYSFLLILALATTLHDATAQTPPSLKQGAYRHFSMPTVFAENRGQWNSDVRFLAQLPAANLWVSNNGTLTFDIFTRKKQQSPKEPLSRTLLSEPQNIIGEVFRLSFGGFHELPQGIIPQSGKFHYLSGNNPQQWNQNASLFQGIELGAGKQGKITLSAENLSQTGTMTLNAEFTSGTDALAFTLHADGKRPMSGNNGSVLFQSQTGTVTLGTPTAWQLTPSGKEFVECAFVLADTSSVAISFGKSNPVLPIVVAVPVLFSAVAGGAGDDMCSSAALDTNHLSYITGETVSADYPTSAGAYSRTVRAKDCFVTKFDVAGTGIAYSTFLGGSGDDNSYSIAVDAAGSAYITGSTTSNDFPATAGAFQTKRRDNPNTANTDCFVAKLTPDGSNLMYATYLGGKQPDVAKAITIDFDGFAYIGGNTTSGAFGVQDSFPCTANAYSRTYNGGIDDGFAAKIGKTGATLEYCSYLGGDSPDYVNALALGTDGTLYATGETLSPTTFPHTPFTIGQTVKGLYECFITKFSPKGDSLRYSVIVGGSGSDGGAGIAVDIFGNAFVTGYTESAEFPSTQGALDTAFNGLAKITRDAFILRLAPLADSLLYSTFFGGTGSDEASSIGIDVCGAAYISGLTNSTAFPLTPDALDATLNNGTGTQSDAFLAKINATGNTLVYSTYLGGANDDESTAIAVDVTGAVYVAGTTISGDFQRTSQFGNLLRNNVFLTKIQVGILPLSPEITPSGPTKFCDGGNVTLTTATNYRLYQWKYNGEDITGATAPQISADKNGRYTVAVTDASGCTGTKEIAVTVFPKPVVFAGRDTLVCPDSTIQLRAISTDSVRFYKWTPAAGLSNTDIPSPVARPSVTTDYIVAVTDTNNCMGFDTIRIVVVEAKNIAVRQFPDTLFVCPGDSLPVNVGIFNSGEAAMNVSIVSSDPRFRVITSAANVPASDSVPANLVFRGSPQSGTFSTRVSVTDVCGNVKTSDIAVFVGTPSIRAATVTDTTVCRGELAERRFVVHNAARPPATLRISGGGGKFSAVPAQITVSGNDSSMFSISFAGDTIAGTYRSTFYVDDQCGGHDSVTITVIVKGTPLVILPSGVLPVEAASGIDRTVNINASDLSVLNESPNKTLGFTLLYDKTTLVLDSITSSQCNVSVVRSGIGKALIRLENCAATVTNPLALAKFRTVVGETLTPTVQITDVIAGDKCIAAGTSPAETVKMLPYGCEIRTLNVQLFASALRAVYPSPANDVLTVEYATVEETAVRIALVSAIGQTVAIITDVPHKPGVYQARFPTGEIPAGSYLLTMDAGQYRNATPVLIAR